VLYLDKARPVADRLNHGEVLVHMLAASISEEDLLRIQVSRIDSGEFPARHGDVITSHLGCSCRSAGLEPIPRSTCHICVAGTHVCRHGGGVTIHSARVLLQTSLSVLNDFAPFNRTNNKWEELSLPAVAGVEGVGVILATAKNVPELQKGGMEIKDWVIALPDARMAPIGAWGTLCVCDSARLIKVPAQLLPLQHLACSRSLCTAYRLLEDYGNVKPGDTVIQNCADMPTGQTVIQLCKMLKIRTINLVPDDAGFDRTKVGATYTLARLNGCPS
jgi:hypothetical protein